MSDNDKPICYCFNISREDVDKFFANGARSYDDFVAETKIGTKCTACLLDLDVHLDSIVKNRRVASSKSRALDIGSRQHFEVLKTFTDSGFCMPNSIAKTCVSLQNYDQCFQDKNAAIDFEYHMIVYSAFGELVDTFKGKLDRNSGVILQASRRLDEKRGGWFILKLRGLTDGHFGTMRPQVLIRSDGWTASYHTQPHSMASSEGHRSGVAVKITEAGSNAAFHVINASRKSNRVTIQLLTHTDSEPVSFFDDTLVGSGGVLYSLNDILDQIPKPGIYNVLINSRYPTRKHIINRLSDGSHSVDHFPN